MISWLQSQSKPFSRSSVRLSPQWINICLRKALTQWRWRGGEGPGFHRCMSMAAWKRLKYPRGRNRITQPQSGQRYRFSHRGSSKSSNQAVTKPCPHNLPPHRGHCSGLGQGNSRPISKRCLTVACTKITKKVWAGGLIPRCHLGKGVPAPLPHPSPKNKKSASYGLNYSQIIW